MAEPQVVDAVYWNKGGLAEPLSTYSPRISLLHSVSDYHLNHSALTLNCGLHSYPDLGIRNRPLATRILKFISMVDKREWAKLAALQFHNPYFHPIIAVSSLLNKNGLLSDDDADKIVRYLSNHPGQASELDLEEYDVLVGISELLNLYKGGADLPLSTMAVTEYLRRNFDMTIRPRRYYKILRNNNIFFYIDRSREFINSEGSAEKRNDDESTIRRIKIDKKELTDAIKNRYGEQQ